MSGGGIRVLSAWPGSRVARRFVTRKLTRATGHAAFRIGVVSAVVAASSTTLLLTPAAAVTGTQRPGLTVATSARTSPTALYVADSGRGRVVEVRPGGGQVVVASGLSS